MFDEKLMAVGAALAEYCRKGDTYAGLDALYAENAVSVEAAAQPGGMGDTFEGIAAIRAKHDWWNGAHEDHGGEVSGPFFHGKDKFSLIFDMDVTNKEAGERMQMREVAVYTVNDGKIVHEEFYYPVE